jgi:FtsH-binding integral membrane protein
MEFDKNGILNRAKAAQQSTVVMDEGLRAYMLKVYNYMATGILLTGIVALLTFKMSVVTNDTGSIVGLTQMGNAIYMSGLKWLVMLAPLGIVFYMSFGINKMSASKAQTTFWVFAGLMGLSLSSILLVYTGMSVTRVFFICSATFGAMSIYGYTTKRDLTKLGSFLMMGLIGIIIASIVNIFMKSSMMYFVISILGVLIFCVSYAVKPTNTKTPIIDIAKYIIDDFRNIFTTDAIIIPIKPIIKKDPILVKSLFVV